MTQDVLNFERDVSRASGRHRGAVLGPTLRERYRQLLLDGGCVTDHDAAEQLGVSLSSVNARRAEWGDKIIAVDRVVQRFGVGPSTSRTRWGWA